MIRIYDIEVRRFWLFCLGLSFLFIFFTFLYYFLAPPYNNVTLAASNSCTTTQTEGCGCTFGDCGLALDNKCHQEKTCQDKICRGTIDAATGQCKTTGTFACVCDAPYTTFPECSCGTCPCTSAGNCGVSCDDGDPNTCDDNIQCNGNCAGGPCGGGGGFGGESPTPTPTPTPTPNPCPGAGLQINPLGPSTINVGQQTNFNASYDSDGDGTFDFSTTVCFGETWTSDDPGIAFQDGVTCVGNAAFYTGSSPGTTNARVSIGSCTAASPITVNALPTLTVDLTATPNSGNSPPGVNSNLSASVSGTATGTINYNFWWNCTYDGTSVSTANSQCGTLTTPASGACVETAGVGYKCDGVNTNPQSVSHVYNSSATAKVIAERGSAPNAEDREPITVVVNNPPSSSPVSVTEPDYCSSGPAATVSWTYSDPDGHPQSAYQAQIDDTGSAWNTPVFDSGKVLSSGTSYFQSGLLFNTTYKARVRVWDSQDLVGNWTEMSICNGPGCLGGGGSWKTPKHAYPVVNFTWSPLNAPPANQPIQFIDQTTFYDTDGVGQQAWYWLFQSPADPPNSTLQNPTYTYPVAGSYNVNLRATDKDGYACNLTQPIRVQRPIPIWKEVSPR